MFGTVLRTRRSADVGRSRSAGIVALLCLALLLPALPVQPASAAPDPAPASSLRTRQPDPEQPLIAFLRQGNLWLMNEDGSGKRQVTISESLVQDFSWSPSGRYLLIQHSGWYRGLSEIVESDPVTELLDVTTGEMWEIERAAEPKWRIASANPPVWATDADELIQVAWNAEDGRTYTLTRIALDGTPTYLATFEEPDICGGPDGPSVTMWQLFQEQHGGGWGRNTYEPVIWSTAEQVAVVRPFCGQARIVDLATGSTESFPYRPLISAGSEILVEGEGSSRSTPRLYNPATGSLQPLHEGDVFSWGQDGTLYYTRIVPGPSSVFTSRFDDFPTGITDNTVELWRTDGEASEPVLIASIPAFGAGVPRVTADGSAVVFGTVDNPTDMIGIDESGVESYTPDIYADHLNAVRVDIATGEATVLTDHAILPKPQPAGLSSPAEEAPADLTGTPEPIAEPTEVAQQPVTTSGEGWIAYTSGGNIWLSRPDGSDQRQVTTDGSPERPYIDPDWSHDGTMLVFSTRNAEKETGNDIYLLREGTVTRVPGIHNCDSAAFSSDNTRLLLLCAAKRGSEPPPGTYPPAGLVSVVDLDGGNWEVVAPFPLEIDGSDSIWWTMLHTTDIDVSAVDGEVLVNTIFMSSARVPQIQLLDGAGERDALFGAPPEERGRIWGSFSADGTNILTRLCRGCYKDSPGPPNSAILLVDREGNRVEMLYTPDPNVTISSVAQSPDGTRLVLRTTTEETDFDFGTAGLTYTTQMVDIATGTATEVPIDGGGFAWQPVAVDIAVPDSTAGLQPTTQFISTAPVVAIACTTSSEGFALSTDGPILPEECSVAEGMRFTVSGSNGEPYGSCTIGSAAFCNQPEIWMPVDVEIIVTVDESTIPEGYAVVGGNPQVFTFGSEYLNTDAAQWLIVLMPADIAATQDQAPAGGSAETSGTAPAEATESASGPGLAIEPGSDWIAYVGDDGNIWLMQPDGSQQTQVTTDGTPDFPYRQPSWSHDGTMLTFARYESGDGAAGIWVLRDGSLTLLPSTDAPCHGPGFSADNQRVLYTCSQNITPADPVPADLTTNPLRGYVTSSALDGSDQRIEVTYTTDDSGVRWSSDSKGGYNGRQVDVRASDGTIMVVYSGHRNAGVHLFSADGTLTDTFDLFDAGDMWLGPYHARLTPDGEAVVATSCTAGCYPPDRVSVHDVVVADFDGNVLETWSEASTDRRFTGADMAPDGSRVVAAEESNGGTGAMIVVYQTPGQPVPIGAGSSPAWQPGGDAVTGGTTEQPGSAPGESSTVEATSQPTGVATESVDVPSGLTIEPESDWIAYEGDDGNIWLMQPDGSQQVQVTTDGMRETPYVWPTWSHNGTMLVFARRPSADSGESATIHVLRGGVVSQVPNVHGCNAAAFMPGDQQLVLGCGSNFPPSVASDSSMQTDPALGFVSMVDLDGSDWHVHVPYHRASEGVWPNHEGGPDMAWVESMSVHPDGTILLSFSGPHGHGLALLEPGSTTPAMHRSPLGRGGVVGRFFPGSDEILIGACKGCYPRANSGDPEFTIAWMDRGGAITTTLYVPDPLQEMGMPTISPDGGTLVFSTNRSIQSLDLATGSQLTIGAGTAVAWQPDATVTMGRPEQPVMVGAASSTGPEPAPATEAPSGAVPSDFVATWSGRGAQANPYGEWAVTVSITGGGVGDIVGTSEYPEEGCGGNLILQEVTADSIVLLEQLTYGQEACADNGTITLSGIDNVAVQFTWSGIGPYGTPSTASGTLYRPDSATGAPATGGGTSAPAGTQGGPVIDTTQLHTFFIGTWAGTGDQLNPTNQWPITVTFTGGRPGEVVGTVEYPTLGCGGELTLDSIDPNDNFLTIYVTERITYGQDNCTDIGSFVFSGVESATRLRFSYASPNVATTAEGVLDPVESGAASTSSSMEAVPGGDAIKHFIGTWEGTGTQSNTGATWPITFTFTNDQEAEVVGSVDYPTLGCGGELSLVSNLIMPGVTSGIKVTEHITYGADNCIDGGTFTFWLAEGGGKTGFNWVSPDGSITARGPIELVEPGAVSAPIGGNSAAPSGTQDGPVVDTTQLDAYYIGTFSGTGNQTDPDNTWPITVTFTGGRPGEVIGTVEYPTLGCGGELILDSINPNDEWRGFRVTERITYGGDNCIDGGTFAFSSAESGIGITFGWTSPVGATRASGHLPEVEPGATTAPADQAPEASGEASGVPPSIYDDSEAEPVPIEAEGG